MSRLGKRKIYIPQNVELSFDSTFTKIKVTGPLGTLEKKIKPGLIKIVLETEEGNKILMTKWNRKDNKSIEMWGTINSLLYNWIQGVEKGFSKRLLINGLGYKAQVNDKLLKLNLGFSHVIDYVIPNNIKVDVEKNTTLTISGIDKELVGLVASQIRKFHKVEPYKGKGIMYHNEDVQRKVGKTAANKK